MHVHSSDRAFATPADLAACRAMLRGGSRTFFAASLVLPRGVRDAATALYAFCRQADDAVDLHGARVDGLTNLRERLAQLYEGRPFPFAADRAFAGVVACFAIPRALPEALLEGFEWDANGRRYEDLSGLYAYAARVAGTVGAMMAVLMGQREAHVLARACDLGVAMQLTNIARDVGEDARLGRLYLPLQWLRDVDIDPDAWLAAPAFNPALGSVVARLLQTADALYERASGGIAHLPSACRPGMHAARILYAEIGREVERRGLDSVTSRAVVAFPRKTRLLGRALWAAASTARGGSELPLEEARFLIEAASREAASPSTLATAAAPAVRNSVPWWNLYDRLIWLIDLFERLERREQAARSGSGST